MRSIVRSSRAGSVSAAVSEAVGSESAPLGIIFLSDYARFTDISKALRDRFPDTQIIGTAGTVYHGSQIDDNSILIVTMITGDASLSAGVITNLSTCPLGDMYKLSESVRAVSPKRDDTVCIEFCTTNEEVLVSSMNVVLKPNNVSLAGGTVFGGGRERFHVRDGLLLGLAAELRAAGVLVRGGVEDEAQTEDLRVDVGRVGAARRAARGWTCAS